MRIKLAKGKQRELIRLAKENRTWDELSAILLVSKGYLRTELRCEKTLLSEKIYNKLKEFVKVDYDDYILEKLNDNWGQSKGGKNSADGLTKKVNFPKESEELAEFFGIMLGDGNLSKIKGYKVGTYQIKIVGDSRNDERHLLGYVKPLIEKLFMVKVHCFKQKGKNALFLVASGKRLVEFLEKKGFKPGDKIKNQLMIPGWIKQNDKFLKACLRGLMDTDGGIYKLNNQRTIQIVFTNYNKTLIEDARAGLISLGISPSKIYDGKRLFITKRSELRKFLKLVGFRNFKNIDKIKAWDL